MSPDADRRGFAKRCAMAVGGVALGAWAIDDLFLRSAGPSGSSLSGSSLPGSGRAAIRMPSSARCAPVPSASGA